MPELGSVPVLVSVSVPPSESLSFFLSLSPPPLSAVHARTGECGNGDVEEEASFRQACQQETEGRGE